MRFSFFMARRFFQSIGNNKQRASNPTITIATIGVAIGLAVMIVSMCVILGFKGEISKKVSGFGGHIEVMDARSISAPDVFPIDTDSTFLHALRQLPTVKSADRIAQKMGILKTQEDFKSITIKGLPAAYDSTFLRSNLVEGRLPHFEQENGNEILISRKQADELRLKVGDRVFSYFFEESIKARRFTIVGIYQSNMAVFDQHIIFAPLSTVSKLNHWDEHQASVVELRLHDLSLVEQTLPMVQALCTEHNRTAQDQVRQAYSIKQHYAQVFAWLDLLDFNMIVILGLMVIVSGFTMISGLFILILERTQTIGVLKALGASNRRIRHIFLNFAALITLRGLLIGNVLALALLLVQHQWGLIHLDASTYYVETVPIALHWPSILLVNALTLFLTTLALVLPSFMISRIQPAKAIRFE